MYPCYPFIPMMPPDLALWLTLTSLNYPCLKLIFIVPKVFEPLKFYCIDQHKYSFNKKLGLRLATNYSWCLLNKPLHISKADTKIFIGGFQAKIRGAGFIPFLGWNTIKMPLNQRPFIHLYFAMHSAILWYRMRFYSISYDCSWYLC